MLTGMRQWFSIFMMVLSLCASATAGADISIAAANCVAQSLQLQLVHPSDSVLRGSARLVSVDEIKSAEFRNTINQLRQLLRAEGGVGIAASQAGISQRFAIAKTNQFGELVLINPKVTDLGDGTRLSFEKCISLPGQCGIVSRNKRVKVEYLDEAGHSKIIEASGSDALIIQHEVDHLDGVLFTDRNGKTVRELGKIGRLTAWRLDSDAKVLTAKFFAELTTDEVSRFQKYLRRRFSKDVKDLSKNKLFPQALLTHPEFTSKNAALQEILGAYKILLSDKSNEQKAELLKQWSKSEPHATYLAHTLETVSLPEAKDLIARLKVLRVIKSTWKSWPNSIL
jgi:peptide deformylase